MAVHYNLWSASGAVLLESSAYDGVGDTVVDSAEVNDEHRQDEDGNRRWLEYRPDVGQNQ